MEKKSIYVVIGLVQNAEGKILLIQRNEPTVPDAHLKWELPGGKVEFGETAQGALEREIFEETGCKVQAQALLPQPQMSMWEYGDTNLHVVIFCFSCKLIEQRDTKTNDHHVADMMWATKEEIKNLDIIKGSDIFLQNI